MSKGHTPGPWTVREAPEPYGSMAPLQLSIPNVASLCRKQTNEEMRANARLIAAAPELLDALKQAVSECRCTAAERYSGHLTDCHAPYWDEVIAKAEGRD